MSLPHDPLNIFMANAYLVAYMTLDIWLQWTCPRPSGGHMTLELCLSPFVSPRTLGIVWNQAKLE